MCVVRLYYWASLRVGGGAGDRSMKESERERYFRDDVIIDLDLFRAHSLCDAECYKSSLG